MRTDVSREQLLAENTALARQLLDREVADAKAKTEQRAKEEAAANARDAVARAEALATEIETTRRGAWVNHQVAALTNAGRGQEAVNVGALLDSIPAHVWPPGVSQSDFYFSGAPNGKAPDDVSELSLVKKLMAKGVKF